MPHVDYEVACQTIGQLIAHQVAILAEEEIQGRPESTRAVAAAADRQALIAARDALRPDDDTAIAHALAVYGPLARQLNARLA